MKKTLAMALAALALVLATVASPPATLAKRGTECTFEKGTTTCTTTKGSHGETDSHHGSPKSSGKDLGGGPCKKTGSSKTNTCP
jgi:hypothetical protein